MPTAEITNAGELLLTSIDITPKPLLSQIFYSLILLRKYPPVANPLKMLKTQ